MAASAVEICLRKRGKANGSSELEEVLLGYYIKLRLGSQESHVYLGAKKWLWHGRQINRNFGIKSLLSENWGGLCLHQNLERSTGTRNFQNRANQRIDCIRIDIS